MTKSIDSRELLRMAKINPKQTRGWLDNNASNGLNLNFSPALLKDFGRFLDEAVDDDGNVDVNAMTGLETVLIAALVGVVAFGLGYTLGSSGDGTTITVTENGDGDVNVNCDGGDGGGGEGDGGGGGNGGDGGGGDGGGGSGGR